MKSKREIILSYMEDVIGKRGDSFKGFTTKDLSEQLQMQRTNVSAILNELVKDNKVSKHLGRPVYYKLVKNSIKSTISISTFQELIGYDCSLKNCVQLAKASIMYPEDSINTIIIGENGSGKSYFAYLMYEFAKEQNIISQNAPFIKFNCNYYVNSEEDLLMQLYGINGSFENSAFYHAQNGVLFIDHIDLLTPKAKRLLFDLIDEKKDKNIILICATDEQSQRVSMEVFHSKFPIHIELPSLRERSLEERLELVERFFMDEAEKVKKEIKINSELLRCFLLYNCQGNVKQLRNDVKVGCANAYVREISKNSNTLHVFIHDCHSYIRKGFIFYKENRDKIESLIPENYTYTFTPNGSKKKEESRVKVDNQNTIYDVIEQKVKELRKREIREEDIMTIVSADVESDLMSVKHQLDRSKLDRQVLIKIVDSRIIDLVDNFLKEASLKFNKVYPTSTFYGICLHLSACLKRNNFTQSLSNEKIMEIVEKYKQEYSFSMNFASKVEKELDIRLPIDEVIFITIFLCENQIQNRNNYNRPSILVVMHGSIASSIANTVNKIYREQKVYSYDLLLDKDMNEAYEELKNLCKAIDNGAGILIIYDMGSVRIMCESIIQEAGLYAKMLEVPITVMTLDCAIKLSTTETVDSVYEDILKNGFGSFGTLKSEYKRLEKDNNKIIITLCRTGEGSALQIKQYLEKNLELDGVNVVALAVGDTRQLIREINYRKEEYKILCVVGTYDPKLHDIPFISIAKLFDTPVDKLPMLLALKDMELSNAFDYSAMYDYLEEQLPAVDIQKLKRHLPRALQKIKKYVSDFTINEEVGLFMHIACSISRIKMDEPIPTNFHKNSVIIKHKRLYHELKDILKPLENSMMVEFNDDEMATIIEILI